ncbi:hypothetical protein [Lactiplantibacillus plantarum]|nr:hypothetical protein [Lactiplantibacillus plantarum]
MKKKNKKESTSAICESFIKEIEASKITSGKLVGFKDSKSGKHIKSSN